MNELMLSKVKDGGFIVYRRDDLGSMPQVLFACSTVAEAAEYMKEKILSGDPNEVPTPAPPVQGAPGRHLSRLL
jgi:hypothetical protein